MKTQPSIKLTPAQLKMKAVLKPMVENIIQEQEKGNYYEFLTMFQQKFSQNMLAINKHLKDALDEKPNFVTDYLEDYFDSTNNPNFYDAFIKLTKNVLYKFKK